MFPGQTIRRIVLCPLLAIKIYILWAKGNTNLSKDGGTYSYMDGVTGVSFAVWAPNAKRVSVIGDFNNWDGRLFPMRSMGASGVWELFIPGLEQGGFYKYEIKSNSDDIRIKTDPFAFAMELRPGSASRIWDIDSYEWRDNAWIENRTRVLIILLRL